MKRKWITKEVLTKMKACSEGIEMFENQGFTKIAIADLVRLKLKTGNMKELSYLTWLIVHCLSYKEYIRYAVYAAKQVLPIYEEYYPKDTRLRQAIKAAEKCIKNPSKANKKTASSAAYAASAAAYAPAYAPASAAYFAASAAYVTPTTSTNVAAYFCKAMKVKILKYGLKLLKNKNKRLDKFNI